MQSSQNNKLRLKLQFFADEPNADEENNNSSEQNENNDEPEKKYTEDEFNERLNTEIQRRLKQKEKEKEDAIKEAEKLAKMGKDQKLQYENEKLTKELNAYKEKEAISEMKHVARNLLSESGIDVTDDHLLSLLVTSTAEQTKENVTAFTQLLNKMVQANVEKALRQDAPLNHQQSSMTKQEIMAIKDDTQRQQAIANNIDLFRR